MKKTKKTLGKLALASLAFLASTSPLVLASCKHSNKQTTTTSTTTTGDFVDQGEVGDYYTLDGNTLKLDHNEVTLTIGGTNYTGTYSFDGKTLTINLIGVADPITASIKGNYVDVSFSSTAFKFYKNEQYVVTFNTNGGSSVANIVVKNGYKVAKPDTIPTKDGATFAGWYNSSDYSTKFDFNKPITSNTTVYARFENKLDARNEFEVNYVSNVEGVTIEATTTTQHKLYNLPEVKAEGKNFVGWWVSDYNDPNKLTYQYTEGTELKQNTTLYAVFEDSKPLVSVSSSSISWDSKGAMKEYAINIKNADLEEADVIHSKKVTTTSYKYDFDALPEGNYIIEVTTGNYTGKAYFANKALPTVNLFVDDFVLSWNDAEDATNYTITVDCGNDLYNVSPTALGDVNEYNFEKIPMSANGITFTVAAEAEGHIQSVATYTLKRLLEAPTVTVDLKTETISWNAVEGAQKYKVGITAEGENTKYYYVDDTNFSISGFTGKIEYTVTAYTNGYYAKTAEGETTKLTLASPKNINLTSDGYVVSWNPVAGAVGYKVKIGDKVYDVDTNYYALSEEDKTLNSLLVSVQAVAAEEKNNSLYSKSVEFSAGNVSYVEFAEGTLTWNPILGVTNYVVIVDDVVYYSNTNSIKLTLTTGHHVYKVAVADSEGNYDSTKLFAYENDVYNLIFDTNGASEMESIAYEDGNVINLPSITYPGYTFTGWFKEKDNITTNEFNESLFTFKSDVVIYAGWNPNTYVANLDYAVYGSGEVTQVEALFGSKFDLPVPQGNNVYKVFTGWYSELNGQGEQYTDEFGNSLKNWRDYKDVTLYASWQDVFEFSLVSNDTAYSVKQGKGISYVTEITIPSEYNGLPVTTIEAAAFAGCNKLVTINIPNSIQNIEVGKEGPTAASNCFQSCSKLESVNIYAVEGVLEEDVKYLSIDGVLIYKNEFNGVELAYIPYYTKTGIYTIPDIVTTIPQMAFKSCYYITEIIVPASVTKIDEQAFASCSKLERVTFLEAENPEAEKELVLGKKIFYLNSALKELTLPARISSFDSEIIASCSSLEKINIVGTYEGAKYTSIDGIVASADGTELIFCPRARAGEYTTPVGVMTIAESAFASCTKLTKVTIGGAITTIGKTAFKSCSGLTELVFEGDETDSPLTICESAFYSCSYITAVELPKNLVKMEVNAFGGTTKLVDVRVLSVAETVDFANEAFGSTAAVPVFYVKTLYIAKEVPLFEVTGVFGSKALITVEVEEGNENFKSIDGVLYDAGVTKVIYYPTEREGSYELPSTIVEIGARVFQSKTEITSITFPASVKSIGESAFDGCNKLTSVTFVEGGTEELVIGDYAFKSCSSLTTLALPSRLTTIGNYAFQYCSKITSISIPDTVTTIGESAFASCSALEEVTLPKNLETLGESKLSTEALSRTHAFQYCKALTSINIDESNQYYKSIDGILYKVVNDADNQYVGLSLAVFPLAKTGSIVLPADLVEIGDHMFDNSVVESITFASTGDKEITFGSYTFYYCEGLKTITLPKGLKTIPQNCFYSCKNLESVVIPNTVTLIMDRVFNYCNKLSSITFEEGGTEGLEFAEGYHYSDQYGNTYQGFLYNNKNITELVLPERTTKIGDYAFANYYSGTSSTDYSCALETITIPSSVTYIGKDAFYYNTNLKNIIFDGEFTELSIGDYAFYRTGISTITLPEATTAIPYYAFAYCTNLKSITIPSSVKTIGNGAFSGTKIETVNFATGSTLETIGNNAFNATLIKTITIPQSVTTIDYQAFYNCTSLVEVIFEGSDTEEGASLETIGYKAFANTGLKSFAFPYCGKDAEGIPNKLTIGNGTTINLFEGSKNLEEVYLSEAIVSIDKLFVKCPSLKKITVSPNSENFKADENEPIILNVQGTAIQYVYGRVKNVVIPEGIESIGSYALAGQTDIEVLTLPKTLKTIEEYAFQNCFGIKEIIFAEGSVIDTIGKYAFTYCKNLEKVTLPNSVVKIDEGAFLGCVSLKELTLPNKLESIGKSAFAQTRSLTSVSFPSTLTEIGQYGFINSGLTEVTFPDGILTIGQESFEDCQALTKVVIPASVTTLNNYIFRRCYALTDVTLAEGLTKIGQGMFDACTALESIELPSSITTIGTYAFEKSGIKNISIPANVTTLPNYMFNGCAQLENVTFADESQLTTLGTYVFQDCLALTSLTLPATVTTIGNYCFKNCGLVSFTVPSKVAKLGSAAATGNVFEGCVSLESVTLPDGLTHLYGKTFYNCTALKSIVVPSKATTLGNSVFEGCTALTSADIQSKMTTVGTYVFKGCTALTDVKLLSTNTKTGNYMFQNCTALTSITLPTSLSTLGTYIFDGCEALETIELPSTVTKIDSYTFRNCTSLTSVVAKGKLTAINTYAFQNCYDLEKIDISAAITAGTLKTLGTYAFNNCTSLKEISLPNVAIINTYAFGGCTALESATISAATTINSSAFYNCKSLKTITLPETLKTLGATSFMDSGLTSITLPKNLTTVGGGVFNGCKNLTVSTNSEIFVPYDNIAIVDMSTGNLCSVYNIGKDVEYVLPNEVQSISTYAFSGVDGIKKLTLSSQMTVIPNYSFQYCSDLEEVVIPDSITEIGSYAFQYCSKLATVNFPTGLKKINSRAFLGTAIPEAILPEGLTYLGEGAFRLCPNLTKAYLPSTLTSVYGGTGYSTTTGAMQTGGVFMECDALTEVTFGEGITTLAQGMFAMCSSLETITLPASLNEKITNATYLFKDCTSLKNVILEEGITTLSTHMFENCTSLVSITLPTTLTTINDYSFAGAGIKTITLPDSVTNVNQFAFSGSSIEAIDLNRTVTLGNSVFKACPYLTTAVVPATVTKIGTFLFTECPLLANVTLAEGLTLTAGNMFTLCPSLVSIEIPSTVEIIQNNMFNGCENLEEVILHEGLLEIQFMTFYNCSKISKITLPSTLTKINYGAFYNCTSIKKLLIPVGCALSGTSTVDKALFGNWTSEQTVCTTESIYDVNGSWQETCSYSTYYGYWSNTNATFVFEYTEEANN